MKTHTGQFSVVSQKLLAVLPTINYVIPTLVPIFDVITEQINSELEVVVCSGIGPHTDPLLPKYCSFLILENECLVAKLTGMDTESVETQIPGTIFWMNIHEPHHLILDSRMCFKKPLEEMVEPWVALAHPSINKPENLLEVEETFLRLLVSIT